MRQAAILDRCEIANALSEVPFRTCLLALLLKSHVLLVNRDFRQLPCCEWPRRYQLDETLCFARQQSIS